MKYLYETYYNNKFTKEEENKLIILILEYVMSISDSYKLKLEIVKEGYKGETLKEGSINKEGFNLINWANERTLFPFSFTLYLYSKYDENPDSFTLFFENSLGNLALNLSLNEYDKLKQLLVENNYPNDIIFPESEQICLNKKIMFGLLEKTNCYTPKTFKLLNNKRNFNN